MRTQSQLSYNMQQTIQWVYSHLSLFSISDFAIMICSIVSSCFGTFSTMTVFLLPHIYVLSLHPLITALCAVKVNLLHYMRSQTTLQSCYTLCFVWDHCTPIRVLLLCSWDELFKTITPAWFINMSSSLKNP